MKYKRFDGIYWFISLVIVLIINIVTWFNKEATLEDIIYRLFLLFFTGSFFGYHVYKWFNEND